MLDGWTVGWLEVCLEIYKVGCKSGFITEKLEGWKGRRMECQKVVELFLCHVLVSA